MTDEGAPTEKKAKKKTKEEMSGEEEGKGLRREER